MDRAASSGGLLIIYDPYPIDEKQTRKELIDPVLSRTGWIKKYIKEEVNSVKSDFNQKHFVLFDVNGSERDVNRFIDYVLNQKGWIESKSASKMV